MANKFQVPKGMLIGDRFIPPGSIIEDTSGVYRVTYSPDGSHVGNSFPTFFPGPEPFLTTSKATTPFASATRTGGSSLITTLPLASLVTPPHSLLIWSLVKTRMRMGGPLQHRLRHFR